MFEGSVTIISEAFMSLALSLKNLLYINSIQQDAKNDICKTNKLHPITCNKQPRELILEPLS
jgi:hypothetical protein